MKLKCKIEKCGHVIDTTGMDALGVPVVMVKHVQERHMKVGYMAIQAITAYLSTFFFDVVIPPEDVVTGQTQVESLEAYVTGVGKYQATKKTLLQGFKEWARTGVR